MLWVGALIVIAAVLIFTRNARKEQTGDSPMTGQQAPKLQIESWVTPNPPDTNELADKPYMLEFWATWCPPCVENIPHLIELTGKYGDKVEIIALSVDSNPAPVKKMVEEENINYHVGMDGGLSDKYGVRGIPAAFIISGEGKVVWSGHPVEKGLEKTLKKLAEKK